MKTRFLLLLALTLTAVLSAPCFAAADRFALVIGNAKYPDADAPLKEPVNDARDLADELKGNGFAVEVDENLTGEGMRGAFDRLYGNIKPGSVVLLFFSGFGIQSARQSYLIPVDAQIWTELDVRRDGFSLETVLDEINSRGASVKIALIDASRRNPFERRFRSISAGLAPVIAPNGSLVMYSAAPGSVISNDDSDHSLFVQELLKEMRVPDLTADETLSRARLGVVSASAHAQAPWISSLLAEDFSFDPSASGIRSTTAATALPPAPSAKPQAEATTQLADADSNSNISGVAQLTLADDPMIKTLTAKIAAAPDDASALYQRGQVYAKTRAYNLAIKDFSDTLQINPKHVDALNNRCWTRAVIGELQDALKDCNEALRLRPNFVDALDSRGLVNLKSGAVRKAIADFSAALKINPHLASSLYGRGLARQRNRAMSRGALDIANAKAMDPNVVEKFASYGIH